MKLYYCPSFTGFVYSDLSNLMFNEKIVDTAGLIAVIKLHAGFNAEKKEDIERTVNYYKAMSLYMKKNPSNIMKDSFEIDSLSVAKECLNWRDTLSFAGWNNSVKAPSKRIEVISGVEEYFTDKSLGDELVFVIDAVKSGCTLPDNLIIETPINYKLFSSLEVELIEALKGRGITVEDKKVPLKNTNALSSIVKALESTDDEKVYIKNDDSFQILHFENQDDACKYLSLKAPDSYDVWINSDNKVLDNWLYLEGKPVSGSSIKGGMPQITQILPIGLSILSSPMDLKNMVEWLNIPVSPLSSNLRKTLAKKISRSGGYYNKDCQNVINDYIGCKYEYEELSENARMEKIKTETKIRTSLVEKFLPDINNPETVFDGTVDINKVRSFTESLYNWCGTEIISIKDGLQKAQIGMVRNECVAVLNMLNSETTERISFAKLMAFVTNLKDGVDMIQYEAQKGCRTVVSNPGQINSSIRNLIWCDFYNEPNETLKYDFLLPNEKEEFKKTLKLWNEDTEREYNRKLKFLPFQFSDRITLVVIDKKVTEDVEKHPILIQMENKIKNLSEFIINPDINTEYMSLLTEIPVINNGMEENAEGLQIKKAGLIQWPDHETYSSFDQLIYNPFDYAFSYLAGISSLGNSSLPKVNSVYGTVAHAVIETLFNKYEGIETSGTVEYIKENIKNNFDKVFLDMVNGYGAVLLLKENILNLDNYKDQVFKCVNSLVKVLDDNDLHVVACEPWLENKNMQFANNIKIGGYADMILADKENNPIVFDFKWYPGKQEKFKEIIKENKSIQLELYKYLTKEICGKEAKAVAYVVLPEVIVVSSESFISENAIKVTVDNIDEQLLPKLKNSYKYRCNQISDGFIEEATGFAPDMIAYQKDVEDKNLIPLNFEGKREPKKQAKPYPEYDFFKTKK